MTEIFIVRNVHKPDDEKLDLATFDKRSSNIVRKTLAEQNVRVLVKESERASALESDPTQDLEIFRGLDPEMLPTLIASLKGVSSPIEITRGGEIVC